MGYFGAIKTVRPRNKFIIRLLLGFVAGCVLGLNFDIITVEIIIAKPRIMENCTTTGKKLNRPINFNKTYNQPNNFTEIHNQPINFTESQNHPNNFTESPNHSNNFTETHNLQINFTEDFHMSKLVATELENHTRVLCWVMTEPENEGTTVTGIKNTWGKRCNRLLFFSTVNDTPANVSLINLRNVTADENSLWEKTKEAFKFIAAHHINEADWFLKADDADFVIMENLRYLLGHYNSQSPLYVDGHFKDMTQKASKGLTESQAGYVLSKGAFLKVVKEINDSSLNSTGKNSFEELLFAQWLESMKIQRVDSRDKFGKHRFIPMKPNDQLTPDSPHWYWDTIGQHPQAGVECCSHSTISYSVNGEQDMLAYEYFTYHIKPFGISYLFSSPEKLSTG